ncbi:MAG: glycogen debranching enzyme N-terminal domain-containing protein, partial [Spirochaetia bacterium]|nr:glycogen debranching enzyme N-terminal domain-containing protein [Spirochaetia bacterium]
MKKQMKFGPIRFDTALGREWLLTNSLGSYASSSLLDCHTRKYHGLLVTALAEPAGHFVLLSKLEASLSLDGKGWTSLATNQYPGAVHPQGFQNMESFEALPIPETVWRVENALVKRQLLLASGKNSLLVRYQLHEGPGEIGLRLSPLLAFRDRHTLTKENSFLNGTLEEKSGVWRMRPYVG